MTAASPRVVSVNAGRVRPLGGEKQRDSAIDKRPQDGPVRVGRLGLATDQQADTRHHGGPDKALYAYAAEDAAHWAAELGRDVGPGGLGENLTTAGIDVTGALIGECWAVGSTLLQTTSPRVPCSTFAAFWDVPDLVKRFAAHGRVGSYFAVLEEGEIAPGDPVRVVSRPAHGLTIADYFRGWMGDRELLARVGDVPELTEDNRHDLQARLRGRRSTAD